MDDARLAVVEDAEIEGVGEARRVPQLEQRPGERDREDDAPGETDGLAAAGVGLRHHGFEHVARWRGAGNFGHGRLRWPASSLPLPRLRGKEGWGSHPGFFLVIL